MPPAGEVVWACPLALLAVLAIAAAAGATTKLHWSCHTERVNN